MKRFLGTLIAVGLMCGTGSLVEAADQDTNAVLDKAIKALGGEEKLGKAEAFTWKAKGKITIDGNDNEFTSQMTLQGIDRYRSEFEGDFGGNKFKGVTVLNGDKGWRKFGENLMEMDQDAVANEKRTVYLMAAPATVLPLKGKGFKVEAAGEEKVGDAPAVSVKVTGPDGKDFKLCFDKESGLPVKLVAKVVGFNGDEYTQEITFTNYKDFNGIKRPTRVESKRDGDRFVEQELIEFKALDKVEAKTFDEPS